MRGLLIAVGTIVCLMVLVLLFVVFLVIKVMRNAKGDNSVCLLTGDYCHHEDDGVECKDCYIARKAWRE